MRIRRRLQSLRSSAGQRGAAPSERPAHWAQPIMLDGVRNLHRVSDALYRSAQPTPIGLRNLQSLGIRTIINLRAFHSNVDSLKDTGVLNHQLHVMTWRIQDRHVVRVLAMLRKTEEGPFLIHCMHGADRTGLMTAMFRIIEQGWSRVDAIAEMVRGGYGYHPLWRNICRYVERVDLDWIADALGKRAGGPQHRLG